MADIADLVASTVFPGRVRQFAAEQPGHALGLAIGAAWCERPRGGHAVAVVPPERRAEALVRAGLDLAGRLELPNLHLVPRSEPSIPCVGAEPCERQPVHLAGIPRSLAPPWGACAPAAALDACAADEPLLLLPGRDPRWGASRAALLALAWIAGDGRRVAWELPRGSDLGAWGAELDLIGRMQLPLKLLPHPGDLPWPPAERGLARWWVAAPDAEDAAGVLAWALAGEECVVAALPPRMAAGRAWMPGAPRRLAEGSAGTVLCLGDPGPLPAGCGALRLTGLHPAPVAELRAAAKPLLTASEDLARHLAPLAALDPALRCALAPADGGPHCPR